MADLDQIYVGLRKIYSMVNDLWTRETTEHRVVPLHFYSKAKNGGTIQFTVGPVRWRQLSPDSNRQDIAGVRWPDKEGAVFVDAAPHKEGNPEVCDWASKKITFAVSPKDAGALIAGLMYGTQAELIHVHEPSGSTKAISLSNANDNVRGGKVRYLAIRSQNAKQGKISLSVGLSDGDAIALAELLRASFHYTLGLKNLK